MTEFKDGTGMKTSYIDRFSPTFSGKFDGAPIDNTATFLNAFASSPFQNLRDFLKDKGPYCGSTNPNAQPKPIPADHAIVWENPDTKEGFVASHMGPCEVWLNENRVFHDDNCAEHFRSSPARIPIDFSTCTNGCLLQFFWLALHEPQWQVYKNCIPIAPNGIKLASISPNMNPGVGNKTIPLNCS
uniref:Uncharacterized protein AlNc14C31G2880 n=1 Tax=Albugo laibachii Nc14 TaxID=890382 RepID=F0W7S7_9STRA|nr:conserved hypothetical protein [Albugo laibachii Nc14]|eukprot:CCA17179.1 conserved hypothetical protein [Albugo laibachii Nc14]